MKTRFLLLCFLLFPCLVLSAWDFGLILNQNAGFSGYERDSSFKYSGSLVPHISGLIGNNSDFYISAGVEAAYQEAWSFIPELLRTEFTFRSKGLSVKAGRVQHSDPLGLIAAGLFDVSQVSYDFSLGCFHAGAWYTGLLYKKRINIEMTPADYEITNSGMDTSHYADTYFAPKRVVSSLGWEHMSLMEGRLGASVAILGQFDLADGDRLNSQYAAAKITVPVKAFSFDLGGCLELIQDSGEFGTAFAGEVGIGFVPQTRIRSKLSLLARYSSGGTDGQMDAFNPVTTISQGDILGARFSGISMLALDYVVRLHDTVSAGLSSSYFMRNDLGTFSGYPLIPGHASDGYFLGNEFFARLLWSPFNDIQLNLGGGIFLPSLGDAEPKADKLWRVVLNVIIVLY
jgi:hypothetical protein